LGNWLLLHFISFLYYYYLRSISNAKQRTAVYILALCFMTTCLCSYCPCIIVIFVESFSNQIGITRMSETSLVSLVSNLVELCVEKQVDLLERTVFTIIESTTNWHRFLELELILTVVRHLQPYVRSAHFLLYSYNLLAFIQFLKVFLDIYVMRYTSRITLCTNLKLSTYHKHPL